MAQTQEWRSAAGLAIRETLADKVLGKLLERSNLTRTQFETILLDQLGSDMANKTLTREEMTRLRLNHEKISRGSFNRTLQQARSNVAESIHTVLLLGYCGLLESPSLAPFLEASERLRDQVVKLREAGSESPETMARQVDLLLEDLATAMDALTGKKRDV